MVDGFTLAPGLAVVPVNLSILDDDTRGLVISMPAVTVTEGGTTVDEDPVTGGAAAYTVVLASQPTGPVTVHADAPAGTIVRVASSGAPALTASLHFTTANWQMAQTVTVTAVHDEDGTDIELSEGLAIAHRVTGADYQGLTVDDTVAVKVIDDDKPRIVVDPAMAEFTEGEELKDAYTVKLRTQPTGDVTVTLGVPAELEADLTTLTFTSLNWETAQTVRVKALEDDDALPTSGTVDYTITHSATGGGYDAAPGDTFTAKVDDDDSEELIVDPVMLTIAEGTAGDVSVKLASEPAGTVRVTILKNATGDPDVTWTPATFTFTTSDWETAQTFRVSGAEDADADDDTATFSISVDSRDSALYGAASVVVDATVEDNDGPSTKVTLSVTPDKVRETPPPRRR